MCFFFIKVFFYVRGGQKKYQDDAIMDNQRLYSRPKDSNLKTYKKKQVGQVRLRGTFLLRSSNTSLDFPSFLFSPLVRHGEERAKQGQKKEGLSNWEGGEEEEKQPRWPILKK